jgi:hypothetical protein
MLTQSHGMEEQTTMKTHVLKGSKQEIAAGVVRIAGDVREAIVFEEEPVTMSAPAPRQEDIFAEMIPYMVDVQDLDASREAIYARTHGE